MQPNIESIVQHAVEAVSGHASLTPSTEIFAANGLIDSIGLVTLIVAIEQSVEQAYGLTITLASDVAMSRRSSPFRSMKSLVTYVENLMKEALGNARAI